MVFLEKIDVLMSERNLNKSTLSQKSGIPYTTIDGWYKKGYANAKLSTVQKLAAFFNVTLDFLLDDSIEDFKLEQPKRFDISYKEQELIKKYRSLDSYGKKLVDCVLELENIRCNDIVTADK